MLQSSGTQAFVSSCLCKLGMELRVQYSLVQTNGETQGTIFTCADEFQR